MIYHHYQFSHAGVVSALDVHTAYMYRSMDMMRKISITIRESTLARLDRRLAEYKRSQALDYAALALMARLDGKVVDAVGYEQAAKALVRS